MNRLVFIFTLLGASIGGIPVLADSPSPHLSTLFVMALVGALFGAPIGGAVTVLYSAVMRRSSKIEHASGYRGSGSPDIGGSQFESDGFGDDWMHNENASPVYSVGDTDPIAKSMSGWKDSSDIHYQRDIAP